VLLWLETLSDRDALRVLRKAKVGSQVARLTNEWYCLALVPDTST
jgi:hypothetical protein